MGSKIRVTKICEFCGAEFTAQTTVTRFCSHKCNSRSYKQRAKEKKVDQTIQEVKKQKKIIETGVDPEVIKHKEYLSIKEAHVYIGVSERTFFRMLKSKRVVGYKFGRRTIIKKSDLENLFKP